MFWFCFSHLLISVSFIGKLILLQLSCSDCALMSRVILYGSFLTGLGALVMHYLKHWLSAFLIFTTASLLLVNFASSISELLFNGLYSARGMSRDIILRNLQFASSLTKTLNSFLNGIHWTVKVFGFIYCFRIFDYLALEIRIQKFNILSG